MPRPVIIKMETPPSAYPLNIKTADSLNDLSLKENNQKYDHEYECEKLEKNNSGSIVRSLIDKFESSTMVPNSTLSKSKSLINLAESKDQSSWIRKKAKSLLDNQYASDDSQWWRIQVVEFLQQITEGYINDQMDVKITKNVCGETTTTKTSHISYYDLQTDSKLIETIKGYFGKNGNEQGFTEHPEYSSSEEEREKRSSDTVIPSTRIQQLRNLFESASDFTHQNVKTIKDSQIIQRLLPTPKVVVLNHNQANEIEDSKQQIEELKRDLVNYAEEINNISNDSKGKTGYINELLIRMLIKLDDIKTYGDEILLVERRKAIEYVHGCIEKLKEKLHGTKEVLY